ncbi:MAG: translocation/assembly module TamB domain-containing protein [Bacteroidota bacterium]
MKKVWRISKWVLGVLLLLILSAYLFLLSPFGQNWLTQRVIGYLSNKWETKIELKNARFSLFDRIRLEGLTVYDSRQDTLLHAGLIQVHVTNWFFLRSHSDIGPVLIEDALIMMQRDDSTWQHDKLFGHFQSPKTNSSTSKGSTFQLQELEIRRSRLLIRDGWEGMNAEASFDRLAMQANHLDPSDPKIDIGSIDWIKPTVYIETYSGKRPVRARAATDFFEILPQWAGPHLLTKSIHIEKGHFDWKTKGHRRSTSTLDPNWMSWSDLNWTVTDLRSSPDSLIASFKFSGKESCGLTLEEIAGTVKGSAHEWQLQNLLLKTPKSSIRQDASWLVSAGKPMLKFEGVDSRISPSDIKFLTGKSLPLSEDIEIKGKVNLDADRIQTKEFWSQWGSALRASGEITVTNWRSGENWSLDFVHSELFARADLASKWTTVSPLQKNYLNRIGYVQFRGEGKTNATQSSFTGNIRTQAGYLCGSGSILYPANQLVSYTSSLVGQIDDLGGLFPQAGIRSTRLTLSVTGKGLQSIRASGELTNLQTHTYRYTPIRYQLTVQDPVWELTTDMKDPNLTGLIQLSGEPFTKNPLIGLDARLEWMDLTALGWNPDGLTLKGSLSGQLSGDGIQNLNGELQGHSLELSRNDIPYSLQEFEIKLNQDGQRRSLAFRSNEMDASIRGNFDWFALPNMALQIGHQYFPSWIDSPPRNQQTDKAEFSVRTYNIESYLELLHLPVRGLSNASIDGGFEATTGLSQLKATLPKLQIGPYSLHTSTVEMSGTPDSLYLIASAEKIQVNDSISIPEARIQLSAQRDTAELRLMAGLNQAEDKADIRSRLIAYSDGLRLDLSPSTFLIQGKLWSIDENGQLIIRKGEPVYGKISMREGDQRIDVRTIPAKSGEDNDIEISVESVNLHDIAPFFLPSNELEGLISAKVRLVDPTGKLRVEADTIHTRLLRFDSDSIGELGAALAFDPISQTLTAKGDTKNQSEHLSFDARVLLAGPVDSNRILLQAHAYPIKVLERFLGNLFSDIRGKLTGEVELLGDLNNPSLFGRGRLNGAGLRVNYTNCFYNIQDADIDITPSLIDLDGWVLKDSATSNPIYIRGGIAHESFRNMYYDLSATTRSLITNADKPVLLLNTDRTQEETYYGTARGTLSLQLRGPQSDLIMNMQARASDKDSSYITLLSEDGRESGVADFLVEREYGREMAGGQSAGGADNFTVDLEITATPLVNAKVVLDEQTGDVIRGRGNGTLKIRSGSNEPLSLRGRYNIDEGNYLFTFQSFFKKPFEIRKGGQHYVEWTGDPYDANIKLEAMYKADNVSFAPLVSSLNLGSGLKNARGDVFVNAELTDKLFQPQIRFSLAFPPNGVVDRNQELSLLVNQLQKNPNELNRQVTYLIVFNSFAPSELAGDPVGSGIGVSTISGVLLNVLSDQINKLLGNLLKSDKYTINLNTSLYNRDWMTAGNNALNLGSNVNFSIGRSFFNNRFIIAGGLGFDAPLGQTSANANLSQSIQLLPDVTMEWLINPSGSLRVGFFYRKSNDFLTNNANPITARRTGGSLSYQKDYDHLGDLFRGLFLKKKNK